VRHRRPGGTDWEPLDLDTATDMIAERVIAARRRTWEDHVEGRPDLPLHRTRGIALLGGATLDTEENYLIKKRFTALGPIQIVNHILEHGREFREYVRHYTNAPVIIDEAFADTEDLDGLFSGWDPEKGAYDLSSWSYAGTQESAAAGQSEQEGDSSGEQSHGA